MKKLEQAMFDEFVKCQEKDRCRYKFISKYGLSKRSRFQPEQCWVGIPAGANRQKGRKMISVPGWLIKAYIGKGQPRMQCRCGLHVYKWSWWRMCRRCVYCGKRAKNG